MNQITADTLPIADFRFPIPFFRYRPIGNRRSQIGNRMGLPRPLRLTPKSLLELSESIRDFFLREVSAVLDDPFTAHNYILDRRPVK